MPKTYHLAPLPRHELREARNFAKLAQHEREKRTQGLCRLKVRMSLTACLLMAASISPGAAAPAAPDEAITTLMKATELTYTEIPGFFQVVFNIANSERKHQIYMRAATETYNSLQANEAFGIVWESAEPADAALLEKAFTYRFKGGGLAYELPSEAQTLYRLRYRLHIDPRRDPKQVRDLLAVVASTSDFMEKELNGEEDKQ